MVADIERSPFSKSLDPHLVVSRTQLSLIFFQEIRATDVPNGGGMGFGKSISGGVDIDDNLYPGRTFMNLLQRMH